MSKLIVPDEYKYGYLLERLLKLEVKIDALSDKIDKLNVPRSLDFGGRREVLYMPPPYRK